MRRALLFCLLIGSVLFGQSLEVSPERLNRSLTEHVFYESEDNWVGHLAINEKNKQISEATWIYVREALKEFQKKPPSFIILELNTPGGQVFAAQKISDALKEMDTQYGVPVVAFINNWAISAGAMLAYSCRYISIVKDASMGAAQPITQSGGKTEVASEKVNSAIRADFANRAAFFDRNPLIAEAMVDSDMILVQRGTDILKLEKSDQIKESDKIITNKGKLLTLNAKQLVDLGVADILLLPKKLVPITEAETAKGVWPFSKELLSESLFFQAIPDAEVRGYQMDWKTRFFALLASPVVASFLFLGLMLCVYIEFNTPGFGVPGALGLFFLFLILLSSFSVEAASWLEMIFLLAGVGLILLELFVIPGFGITGILGIVLVLAAVFALLVPGIKEFSFDFGTYTFNAAGSYALRRIAYLSGALVVGALVISLLGRYVFPKIKLFSPLVLKGEQESKKGYVAGIKQEELPPVGTLGEVSASLRPAGKVVIKGEVYDAKSIGEYIEKGEKVRVVALQGSNVVVERV